MRDVCRPPFGDVPNCFKATGFFMITSSACAAAHARMWNISNPTPLIDVAASVNAIQDACATLTNEVWPHLTYAGNMNAMTLATMLLQLQGIQWHRALRNML